MASTGKPADIGEGQLKHLCPLLSHSFLRATPLSFTLGGNSEFQFLWIHCTNSIFPIFDLVTHMEATTRVKMDVMPWKGQRLPCEPSTQGLTFYLRETVILPT